MLHVGVCCAVLSVPYGLVVTRWERADLLIVVFVVFCHSQMCPGSTSVLRVSPPVKYFTDRSKAVLLLWIFYVFWLVSL